MPIKCSDEEFVRIVSDNKSVCGVLFALHMPRVGSAYSLIRREISRLGLDTSHFCSPCEKVVATPETSFIIGSKHARSTVKNLLLKMKIVPNQCAICGLKDVWNGLPIILRLDHVNGIRDDNRIENLRLLCPNCDSQTKTFCGRNVKRNVKRSVKAKAMKKYDVCTCGSSKRVESKKCSKCSNKTRKRKYKIIWPSISELKDKIKKTSCFAVARELGVSDTAINKHLRLHDRVIDGAEL